MNEALDLAVLFVHPPIAEPPRHEKTNLTMEVSKLQGPYGPPFPVWKNKTN